MSKTGLEVLTDARPFIADHWTKGSLRDLVTGNVCAIGAVLAGRYSIDKVSSNSSTDFGSKVSYIDLDDGNGAREAVIALFDALPQRYVEEYVGDGPDANGFMVKYDAIVGYNDLTSTTQADVLALFDRAIAALKAKEAQA